MNLITRAAWGARRPKSEPMRIGTVDGVAVHWEGPPLGAHPHTMCADRVRSIQRFHMDARGWNDIAYNLVVCPHGSVFEGRGWGARSAANGTQMANEHFHAVCYLGGEGDPFTAEAKSAIVHAVAESRRRYPAGSAVRPHSSFRPTACPGDVIRRWLASDPFTNPQEDDVTPEQAIQLAEARQNAIDAKNYGVANQSALAELFVKVDALAAGGVDEDALADRIAQRLADRLRE